MTEKKPLMMSASDLALTAGDTPDLPTTPSSYVALLAPLSQALDTSSDRFIADARAGDFVVYTSSDKPKVFAGATGFVCMVLGFEMVWMEYPEGDEPIRHAKKPSNIVFLERGELGNEGPGTYRVSPNGELGNRVLETLVAYLLIDGIAEVVSMSFAKTALKLCGRGFKDTAQKLAVRTGPDGLQWITGCTLAKFRITSRLVDNGTRRWNVPKATLIAKLGEEGGPTIEEWRHAQELRMAAKAPPAKPLASPPVAAPTITGPTSAEPEPLYLDDNPNLVPEGVVEGDITEDILD
jgi:hypothetical protein